MEYGSRKIVGVVMFLFSVFFLSLNFVFAAGESFGIAPVLHNDRYPSWFIYEMRPGDTIEDEFFVNNNAGRMLPLRLYPQDADNASKDNNVFKVPAEGGPGANGDFLSKWIKLEQPTIKLGINELRKFKFKLTVPPDAEKREYGAVIFAHLDPQAGDTGTTIESEKGRVSARIGARVGVRVYLTVTDKPNMPRRYMPVPPGTDISKYIFLAIVLSGIFGGGYYIFKKEIKRFFNS